MDFHENECIFDGFPCQNFMKENCSSRHAYRGFNSSKLCFIIKLHLFFIGLGKILSDVRWRRATARWKAADLYFPTRCRTPPTDKYARTSDMTRTSSTSAQLQIGKFSMVENLKRCVFSYRIV